MLSFYGVCIIQLVEEIGFSPQSNCHIICRACHNRFEHSLGVAHLAYRFARHIQAIQGSELDLERRDLRIVELAGVCERLISCMTMLVLQ